MRRPPIEGNGWRNFMAAFEQRLEGKIDSISNKMETLTATVAGMMPRSEVDAEIARRVSAETYASDQRATNERLIRLESSPMRFLAWASAGVGCLGILMSFIAIIAGVLEYALTHH